MLCKQICNCFGTCRQHTNFIACHKAEPAKIQYSNPHPPETKKMSSDNKIIVVKMREIVYTLLLLFLVILLIVCLFLMFSPGSDKSGQITQSAADDSQTQAQSDQTQIQTAQTQAAQTEAAARTVFSDSAAYTPGIYTAPVTLGSSSFEVEVAVDQNHINSIRLVNLSTAAENAYPLLPSALENIALQILATQKLVDITCPPENRYTSQLLLSAVSDALSRAGNAS